MEVSCVGEPKPGIEVDLSFNLIKIIIKKKKKKREQQTCKKLTSVRQVLYEIVSGMKNILNFCIDFYSNLK